jgi:uncharacterized protein
VNVERDVRIEMADAVGLYADVYLPAASDRHPVLLQRTPYGRRREMWLYAPPRWYADRGYVVVVQDVRGRWDSEGDFYPFRNEGRDGAETIAWISEQEWCNGSIGMYGMSYAGAVQLLAAAQHPPALKAIAPGMTGSTYCEGWTYEGGVLSLAFILSWAVGFGPDHARRAGDLNALTEFEALAGNIAALYQRFDRVPLDELLSPWLWKYLPYLRDWLAHRRYDEYWQEFSPLESYRSLDLPALHIAGWYDSFLAGTIRNFQQMRANGGGPQHLVAGPWYHVPWFPGTGERWFGPEALNPADELQVRFFDRYLCGGEAVLPPVRSFVMGENGWREEEGWPPPASRDELLYLHSGGRANSSGGDGRLSREPPGRELADSWLHDPRIPVLSAGGHSCCWEALAPMGPRNQVDIEARNDVLVYGTAPLASDVVIAGEVRAELYVTTSGESTDVAVRLVEAHPCGSSYNLCDTIVRIGSGAALGDDAFHRVEGLGAGLYRIHLSLGHTHARIPSGNVLRLEVTGSSFPGFELNWNRYPPSAAPFDFRSSVTIQELLHQSERPSALILPIEEGELSP